MRGLICLVAGHSQPDYWGQEVDLTRGGRGLPCRRCGAETRNRGRVA